MHAALSDASTIPRWLPNRSQMLACSLANATLQGPGPVCNFPGLQKMSPMRLGRMRATWDPEFFRPSPTHSPERARMTLGDMASPMNPGDPEGRIFGNSGGAAPGPWRPRGAVVGPECLGVTRGVLGMRRRSLGPLVRSRSPA